MAGCFLVPPIEMNRSAFSDYADMQRHYFKQNVTEKGNLAQRGRILLLAHVFSRVMIFCEARE